MTQDKQIALPGLERKKTSPIRQPAQALDVFSGDTAESPANGQSGQNQPRQPKTGSPHDAFMYQPAGTGKAHHQAHAAPHHSGGGKQPTFGNSRFKTGKVMIGPCHQFSPNAPG
jgi:hypothetical protein